MKLGFPQVVFEGNFEGIIKVLTKGYSAFPSFCHLVKGFKSIWGLCCFHFFSHVKRQGNYVVYAFAQRARLSFPLLVWMEDVPLDVFQFVFKDFLV